MACPAREQLYHNNPVFCLLLCISMIGVARDYRVAFIEMVVGEIQEFSVVMDPGQVPRFNLQQEQLILPEGVTPFVLNRQRQRCHLLERQNCPIQDELRGVGQVVRHQPWERLAHQISDPAKS